MTTTNYKHGVFATDQTLAPTSLRVAESGEIGIIGTAPDADPLIWPENTPIEIIGNINKIDSLGEAGTLKRNLRAIWSQFEKSAGRICVVRVPHNDDPTQVQSAMVGEPALKTGVHAFFNATNLLSFEPDLLIAPEYGDATSITVKNPVVTELEVVAKRLRSIVFFDAANSNSTQAKQIRQLYSSDRALMFEPKGLMWDTSSNAYAPISLAALAAGVQSRLDVQHGFWHSFDNKEVFGIGGSTRPIDWRVGDTGSEANDLNSNQVTTLIRKTGVNIKNGYRLWGGETLDTARLLGGTIVGRRVADKVYDTIEGGLDFAIGTNFSLSLLKDIEAKVSEFLSDLMRRGALVNATFSLPQDENTPQLWADGGLIYRLNFAEAAPVRAIEIWGRRDPELYQEFITKAAALEAIKA